MRRHIAFLFVIVAACASFCGCGSKPATSGSNSQQEDFKTFELAGGAKVSCWVSGNNHAGERSWIWCDAASGPVAYRISGPGQTGEWKPMTKIRVSDDEKLVVTPDANGKFGAVETLPRGNYAVSFKIGTEEFSAVTLGVD